MMTAIPIPKKIKNTVNGILLLDKPIGLSSNHALQKVKHLFNAKKAGHTGSLDPLATGMLPICFGEATKFSQFLLDDDKTYRVTAKLGIRTNTSDSEGEIISTRDVGNLTHEKILSALDNFRGSTQQIPSMFSALKYQGKPLYDYARQGIDVDRKSRTINVYRIDLLAFAPDCLTLEVECSKGTYIRTIIDDLGELLGCGAHVIELRRLNINSYKNEKMFTLEALQKAAEENVLANYLLPVDTAIKVFPEMIVDEAAALRLKQGQAIRIQDGIIAPGYVRLKIVDGQFIGLGEVHQAGPDGLIVPKRLVTS